MEIDLDHLKGKLSEYIEETPPGGDFGVTLGAEEAAACLSALEAQVLTPTSGDLNDREHMAFILRIFMYYVELTPNKKLSVDLNQVLKATVGRQMQVKLDGAKFEARTIAGPIPNEKRHLLI